VTAGHHRRDRSEAAKTERALWDLLFRRLPPSWAWFTRALEALLVVLAVVLFFRPDDLPIVLYLLLAIPTSLVLAMEPVIFLYAPHFDPWLLGVLGSAGATLGAFLDYNVIRTATNHPRIAKVKTTRLYKLATGFLLRYPGPTIFTFMITPVLPIWAMRVLVPTYGYPLPRYLSIMFVARSVRIYLLARLGEKLNLPPELFVPVIAAFAVALAVMGVVKYRRSQALSP
jgi:uncharacterized membrane protein YdjX (TVP38/TMEM64 family)